VGLEVGQENFGKRHFSYISNDVPYLCRVHHTLELWRLGRDDDGWKYNATDWMQYLDALEAEFDASNKED